MTGVSENTFESTPTWVTALISSVIIAISLVVELILHSVGKFFKRNETYSLYYQSLKKIKIELRVMGTISLLLTVFQNKLNKLCVPAHVLSHMLPCKVKESADLHSAGREDTAVCSENMVSLLSIENLHEIHTFMFVLAVVHIIMTLLVVVGARPLIRRLEDSAIKLEYDIYDRVLGNMSLADKQKQQYFNVVIENDEHLRKIGRYVGQSFFKQFNSVTESDYNAVKLFFFTNNCKLTPRFDFCAYMYHVLECNYKQVVGISWYLWISVVLFLLLNVHGWHVHFWTSLIPVIVLLATGANLKHIITQFAHKVVQMHGDIQSFRNVGLDKIYHQFWFWPRISLGLIHFALFQSTLEVAYGCWVLVNGYDTCITGNLPSIVSRLTIGVFVIVVCSYSTLPLYAAVSQMGTDYQKEIIKELSEESTILDIEDPGFYEDLLLE